MELEIERKFLLKDTFDIKSISVSSQKEIVQGYLKKNIDFRIRIVESEFSTDSYLTYKKGKGVKREEYETNIPLDMGKELLSICDKKIEKTRYIYTDKNKKIWEIDFIKTNNLWLAEIELDHENESIILPDFIKKEVTGKQEFSNLYMAK